MIHEAGSEGSWERWPRAALASLLPRFRLIWKQGWGELQPKCPQAPKDTEYRERLSLSQGPDKRPVLGLSCSSILARACWGQLSLGPGKPH